MARKNIFEPIHVYEISRDGLKIPAGQTMEHAWAALDDIGNRIACPRQIGETIVVYLARLSDALGRIETPTVNGAAVHALLHELAAWRR